MIFKFSHSTLEGKKYPLENVPFLNCWENVGENHTF